MLSNIFLLKLKTPVFRTGVACGTKKPVAAGKNYMNNFHLTPDKTNHGGYVEALALNID